MPPQTRERRPLAAALLGSVILHASAAALLSRHAHAAASRATDPADTIPVGIEESREVTVTWLGFQEPTPHEAPRARIDQPQQSLADASRTPPSPPADPNQSPIQSPDPATSEPTPPEPTQAEPAQSESAEPAPPQSQPSIRLALPAAHTNRPAVSADDFQIPPAPTQDPTPQPNPTPAPDPTQQSAQQPPKQPTPPPSQPTDRPADRPAERESDAASRTEPTEFKLGDPVATEGLRIDTRVPPRHSIQTRLQGARFRPVFEVSFRKDGTVAFVRTVRTSGDPDVDEPWRNALYEWKASGRHLDELPADDPNAVVTRRFTPVPIPG